MSDDKRITLQLVGQDEDHGDVRFDDFIKQLDIIKKALSETERIVLKEKSQKKTVYYRVVDLSHNSPALVVLEAVSVRVREDRSRQVVDTFFRNLDNIEEGTIPDGFDYDAIQAFKKIPSLYERKRITEINISRNGDHRRQLNKLSYNIDKIMGPDEYEYGSVTGMLEQINIHSGQNVFTIYPTSDRPKLRCKFLQDLREDAIEAVGKYVCVFGKLKHKPKLGLSYPYEIMVSKIDLYPPEDQLPTLASFRGIISDMEDIASEDFIRRTRDEWK